jgi:hypothetical protein
MTEAEWHTCDDPRPMLEFVQSVSVSERRLRLFILACCRRIWGQREDGPTVVAMQTVERLATRGRGVLEQGIVKVASGEAKINCSASDPLQQLVEVSLLFPMDTFPFQVEPALVRAIEDLACEDTIARTIPWATELFKSACLQRHRRSCSAMSSAVRSAC